MPRGDELPVELWQRRHRGIMILAAAHAPVLLAINLFHNGSWTEALLGAVGVAALAAGGLIPGLPRVALASLVTLSLLTSTALLIHNFHGLIEIHFHFFVVIAIVAMYQQWTPYLIALGYVLLHHAVLGVVAPRAVYNHEQAVDHPVRFAIIHGGFVLAESVACLAYWRLNEQALAGERAQRRAAVSSQAALERANAGMADLMAMLSHDLRTPLTVVNGTAEVLESAWEDLDDDRRRQMLARVGRAGRSLEEMLEHTLTVGALEGEGLRPHPEDIDLADLVEGLVHSHAGESHFDTAGLGGARVLADRRHLTRIVSNLLSNAIKYGAAPFTLAAQHTGDLVALRVHDSGEGVPAEFVPHLFERYSRADEARAGEERGTGLGLYIVRRLAEANGGSAEYRSLADGGAEFVVLLPAAGRDATRSAAGLAVSDDERGLEAAADAP